MSLEDADKKVKVVCTKTGPNLVYNCAVSTTDGESWYSPGKPIALCACGKTKTVPLCDGSHLPPKDAA